MQVAEILPWLNVLLVPVFGYVVRISSQLAAHDARLDNLERARA